MDDLVVLRQISPSPISTIFPSYHSAYSPPGIVMFTWSPICGILASAIPKANITRMSAEIVFLNIIMAKLLRTNTLWSELHPGKLKS